MDSKKGGGFGLGSAGKCVCPNCRYVMIHQVGIPCYNHPCPKCGTMMTRQDTISDDI